MDENMVYEMDGEDEPILPDGYADGDDFFNPDSWTGSAESESASEEMTGNSEGDESTETVESDAHAIEQDGETETAKEEPADSNQTPATEPGTEETSVLPLKYKAKYKFNHQDVEEEIDLATQLPEILQKARSMERYKEQNAQLQGSMDRVLAAAKIAGYDGSDAFIDEFLKTARENERESMLAKGTAPEVADYILGQKYSATDAFTKAAPVESTPEPEPEPTVTPSRDYHAEAKELLAEYPEMIGKQLPDSVMVQVASGTNMLAAYRDYKEKTAKAENEKLRKENRILKQNAASADRAPVSGVTKGGSTAQKADDPFLAGFNSGW